MRNNYDDGKVAEDFLKNCQLLMITPVARLTPTS